MSKLNWKQSWGPVVALVAGLILFAAACEDSDIIAPAESTFTITSGTPIFSIEAGSGDAIVSYPITVRIFDASSLPQSGVRVFFTADGGQLTSGVGGLLTDGTGSATDTLTLRLSDPAAVTVTGSSGSLSEGVEVSNALLGNLPPTAVIEVTPPTPGQVGTQVRFDGSGSTDPDGDQITCYQWTITSDCDPGCDPNVDPDCDPNCRPSETIIGQQTVPRTYGGTQNLVVVLQVSDELDARANCLAGRPVAPELFSPDSDSIVYDINCSNTTPVARTTGNQTGFLQSGGIVNLNASLSSDPDGTIVRFVWDCGGGTVVGSVPVSGTQDSADALVQCQYTTTGNRQATVTVFDDGDGTQTMGVFNCQSSASTTATVSILQ